MFMCMCMLVAVCVKLKHTKIIEYLMLVQERSFYCFFDLTHLLFSLPCV